MKQHLLKKSLSAITTLLTRRLIIIFDGIPYKFRKIPPKKLLNWLKVETSIYVKPKKPWGIPTHLQMEPTTVCNLRCTFCPVTTGLKRKTGIMTFETFKKAIDETGDYLFFVILWDWGEPFLNPSIFDMIEYAKQRDIKIISSTNGHSFAEGDNAERLIRSRIDSIIFAVDGISQETYEKYRSPGKLQTVLDGLQRVVEAKRKLKASTPLIHLRFLAMKHNEHEIPVLKQFAKSLGVDVLSIKTLNPHDQGECYSTKADGLEYIPENPRYQRFEYNPEDGSRIRLTKNPCKRLWNNPVVHWDGRISPCDMDPHGSYNLGDLNYQTFCDIWKGISVSKIRQQFKDNYQNMQLCCGCSYAFKGGCTATEAVAEVQFFNKSTG